MAALVVADVVVVVVVVPVMVALVVADVVNWFSSSVILVRLAPKSYAGGGPFVICKLDRHALGSILLCLCVCFLLRRAVGVSMGGRGGANGLHVFGCLVRSLDVAPLPPLARSNRKLDATRPGAGRRRRRRIFLCQACHLVVALFSSGAT